MGTIQWRPEVNALTAPQSYRPRFVPREVLGYDELAAEIVKANPTWNIALVKSVMAAMTETIKECLINGSQVTLENSFTYHFSLSGRMDAPDDPLPPADDLLQVKIYAARAFVNEVRQAARLERLPAEEKTPVVVSAEDTRLKLADVLYSKGALRLTGSNLLFDEDDPDSGCVLEGTRSGKAAQSQFASVSNAEILLVPDIPAQPDPWNNEYTLTVATHYTEHGSLRSGVYRRRLRSPLLLSKFGHPNPPETGILTGNASVPYVTVTEGALAEDEMLRIQAMLDPRDSHLALNLLDMKEDGRAGTSVTVPGNGTYVLPGFAGSALSRLTVTVQNYAELVNLVKAGYAGRLADILDMRMD